MKWIIILSLLVFSVACSKDMGELQTSGASLKCNLSLGQLEAAGGGNSSLKAGGEPTTTPPGYVAGITLTAHNNEYGDVSGESDDVVQSFNFATTVPQNIVMTGLTVGNNTITAKGISEGEALNKQHIMLANTIGTLQDKANSYATQLRGKQPIYANYESENPVDVNVSNSIVENVNINMVTENHRVAIVIENPASDDYNYMLAYKVYEENHEDSPLFSSWDVASSAYDIAKANPSKYHFYVDNDTGLNVVSMEEGTQDAVVINNQAAVGTITYKIEVNYYTYTTNHRGVVNYISGPTRITKTIIANSSENITKLFYFNKGELEVGTAIFSNMIWADMDDDIGTSGNPGVITVN